MLNPARPYFYLLAYIVVLYIRPQEYVPSLIESPLVPVSLLFAALFWLVAQARNFEAPQHKLILGLLVGIFISVLIAAGFSAAIAAVTDFIPTLLLFYLTATSVDSLKRFREICIVLTAVTAVIALHGYQQAANELGVGWTGAKMIEERITYLGFLNDPNDLSMALLMTLPLTLYLARTSTSFLVRHACYATTGLILYAIYLCNSRGSMLGLLAMLLFYTVRCYGWLRSLVGGPLLVGLLLLLAPSRVSEMSADEESAAGRVDAWYTGFELFRSHPLFGVGKGLFTDHSWLTAHNSFVLGIAELGFFGYFFWLSILILSVVMLKQLLQSSEPPNPGATALVGVADSSLASLQPDLNALIADGTSRLRWEDVQLAAAALTYSFIGSIVAAFFLSRTYVVFLYLLVALIVALYQITRARWPDFAPVQIGGMLGNLITIEIASIAGLWLLTRILLAFS